MTEYAMIEVICSRPNISEHEVLSSAHQIKLFNGNTLLITTANHAAEMLTH